MNGINIITANFSNGGRQCITRKIYQYDYGQKILIKGLRLPQSFEVHISNNNNSISSSIFMGNNNEIEIPDEFLISGENIYIWIFLHQTNSDGETRYIITIPVQKKPKPESKEPTVVEKNVIDQLIAALENNLNKMRQTAQEAKIAVLNYPKIIDEYWYYYDVDNKNWINSNIKARGMDGISIDDIIFNQDHSITIKLSNGQSFTSQSLQGPKGDNYVLTQADKQEIADMVEIPDVPVKDVQIHNSSIVNNEGLAKIPIAASNVLGVVRLNDEYGLTVRPSTGEIAVYPALDDVVKNGSNYRRPVVPSLQHAATFYGLAKAAGHDEKDSELPVGQYSNEAKTAIQEMLGIDDALNNKVNKETGKGLSENDYTTADKNKLAGIEANATNTIIDSTLTIAGDAADAKAVGDELSKITRTYDSNTAIIPERVNDDGTFSSSSTNSRTDYVDLSGALGYSLSESMSITVSYYDANKVYLESKYFSVDANELINTPAGVGYVIVNGSNAKMEGLRVNVTKNTFKKYVDDEINDLKDDLNGKLSAPLVAGSQGQVLTADGEGGSSWEDPTGGGGTVTDVQVNGTSIVTNGVADIPIASNVNGKGELGLVQIDSAYGITSAPNGVIVITKASQGYVKGGSQKFAPIVPFNQHESTFYGLTKAAGVDMASSSNPVGTYTPEAKAAIQQMLGIDSAIADAIGDITSIEFQVVQELPVTGAKGVIYLIAHTHGEKDIYDEYIWLTDKYERLGTLDVDLSNYVTFDDIPVKDVQINDVSIVDSETGIADVPLASDNTIGVVKTNINAGITVSSLGSLTLVPAGPPIIKAGTETHKPIMPSRQHNAVFYGLAKIAGHDEKNSELPAGQYTDEAKAAIQEMLDVPSTDDIPEVPVTDVQVNGTSILDSETGIANVPYAGLSIVGVVSTNPSYGIQASGANNTLIINRAYTNTVKAGTDLNRPIVPECQHAATFYGLAKAAGDTTQSQSDNAVGTYTDSAKAAILSMLGVETGVTYVENVSGTTPTITGVANHRYICGEVTTISITPPSSGIVDVIFTSGSTAAVLTLPSTVVMPEWFDATALEADTIYEINIIDGIYGAVMTWPI